MNRINNLTFLSHVDIQCANCGEHFPCLRGLEREFCSSCEVEPPKSSTELKQAVEYANAFDKVLQSIFPIS